VNEFLFLMLIIH